MDLQKLSDRSENIVNRIINQLSKRGEVKEGRLWVSIPAGYFAKSLKLTKQSIFNHLKKLRSEGILISKQFDLMNGNPTNYYSIDLEVITSSKFKSFFCAPIIKRLESTYNITEFNNPTGYKLNSVTSSVDCHKSSSRSLDASSASASVAQDMLGVWNEEFSRQDNLTKRVSRYLVACYKRIFKSFDRWREYVKSLKISKYITNRISKLKNFLSWALSFRVIDCIKAGGFGVKLGDILLPNQSLDQPESGPTEDLTNHRCDQGLPTGNKEGIMRKKAPITDDRFSKFFDDEMRKYEGDERAINLLRGFAELYGDYKFYEVFRHAHVHLRGNKLRIYFRDDFSLSRFERYGEYEKFKEYCDKTYDFKVEFDPYYDRSRSGDVFDVGQMKLLNS